MAHLFNRDVAVDALPAKALAIPTAVDNLSFQTSELLDQLHALRCRLEPVSRTIPEGTCAKSDRIDTGVPLAEAIQREADRIDAVVVIVKQLLIQLEV